MVATCHIRGYLSKGEKHGLNWTHRVHTFVLLCHNWGLATVSCYARVVILELFAKYIISLCPFESDLWRYIWQKKSSFLHVDPNYLEYESLWARSRTGGLRIFFEEFVNEDDDKSATCHYFLRNCGENYPLVTRTCMRISLDNSDITARWSLIQFSRVFILDFCHVPKFALLSYSYTQVQALVSFLNMLYL